MNLVVSGLDASRLGDIHPGVRTSVIANGVDVDYFRACGEASAEPGHLIMVSGMNWFPNLDAVLFMTGTIWPALTKVMPDVKLTIVGARPPQSVKSLEARDSRITVTGFVDDIRPYMDRAQVYLCPMRDGGGTRLKILDALSMGKPIVATTIALEGIDVAPEKEVLVGDTPDEFVRQIRHVMNDGALRREPGHECAFVRRAEVLVGGHRQRDGTGLQRRREQEAPARVTDTQSGAIVGCVLQGAGGLRG